MNTNLYHMNLHKKVSETPTPRGDRRLCISSVINPLEALPASANNDILTEVQ